MADISQSSNEHPARGGKVRSKKSTTKIDMTPMVDLAFLLLTFFVLTTSLNQTVVMPITMPEHAKTTDLNYKRVLSVMLDKHNAIYWYQGIIEGDEHLNKTNFSKDGIRKLLRNKRTEIKNMVVLIKPTDESSYQNVVDILDEMSILEIERYTIVDVTPEEEKLITKANL